MEQMTRVKTELGLWICICTIMISLSNNFPQRFLSPKQLRSLEAVVRINSDVVLPSGQTLFHKYDQDQREESYV